MMLNTAIADGQEQDGINVFGLDTLYNDHDTLTDQGSLRCKRLMHILHSRWDSLYHT